MYPQILTKFVIPVVLDSGDKFLQKLTNWFFEGLYEVVGGRIVCCRRHILNPKLVAEHLEGLSDKLRAVVMDDAPQDAEAVDDAVVMNLTMT